MLSLYFYDPFLEKYVALNDINGPIVKNKNGLGYSIFYLKNETSDVICDITTLLTNSGSETLTSAVTAPGVYPSLSDFISGADYSYTATTLLKAIEPGDGFMLYVSVTDPNGNTGIDFNNLTLDISYCLSHFSTLSLAAHFEFTEAQEALATFDSYSNIEATVVLGVPKQNVIKGSGRAYFANSGDKISFTLPTISGAFSLFVKGIVKATSLKSIFLHAATAEIGLDAARHPYLKLITGTGTMLFTADNPVDDILGDHIFGFSASLGAALLTVDGSIQKHTLTYTGNAEQSVITPALSATGVIGLASGGNQLIGDIDSVTLFEDFKDVKFHKIMADRL